MLEMQDSINTLTTQVFPLLNDEIVTSFGTEDTEHDVFATES